MTGTLSPDDLDLLGARSGSGDEDTKTYSILDFGLGRDFERESGSPIDADEEEAADPSGSGDGRGGLYWYDRFRGLGRDGSADRVRVDDALIERGLWVSVISDGRGRE